MDTFHTNSNKSTVPKSCIYVIGLLAVALAMRNVVTSGSSLRGVSLNLDVWFQDGSQPSRTASEQFPIAQEDRIGIIPIPLQDEADSVLKVLPTDRIMDSDPEQWDRSPIVIEEFRLVFFSIPKVACTTWKQLFRRIMGEPDWQSQDLLKYLPHNPKLNNLKYLHHYNLTQVQHMFVHPNWTKAIFVREPKQRFLSAYLDKAVSYEGIFLRDKCCAERPRDRPKCNSIPKCRTCWEFGRSNLSNFLELIHTCRDDHWELQSARMDTKYWKYINFVGKMDTLAQDGIRLLERIGAWEKYGKDGWGPHGNGSMFTTSKEKQSHTTNAKSKMQEYYTPDLEKLVEDFYQRDYNHPLFGFAKTRVTS